MMNRITNNYRMALVEVETVLSCLELESYNKIPQNVIKAIEKNKDESYHFEYDKNIEYEEWNLMDETRALLYNIFKKYLATDEEKEYFTQKEKYEAYKLESEVEKDQKYQYEDLFKNNKKEIEQPKNNDNIDNVYLISHKQGIFARVFNKIKNLFKVN